MSWAAARKVLAAVAGALAWFEAAAAAELLDELQAVTSMAAQAGTAQPVQPAARRVLRAFVVNMDSSTPQKFHSGSVSHLTYTTSAAPPWLGQLCALRGAETAARSA